MTDLLIFSKDRACQLECLLHSISDNFKDIIPTANILYKSSSELYKTGYDILQKQYPMFKWIPETSFLQDVRKILNDFKNETCMFFSDDEIVINDCSDVYSFVPALTKNKDKFHCLSLRMHPKIDFTYTWKLPSPSPKLIKLKVKDSEKLLTNLFAWEWKKIDTRLDWGFPSCVNSHIYLTEMYRQYINTLEFKSLNNLEILYHFQREKFKDLVMCFDKAKTVSVANNITQEGFSYTGNNKEFSVEVLNQKFLDNWRIDVKKFYGIEKNMATFDEKYEFVKI
jgi:hypothetical protein